MGLVGNPCGMQAFGVLQESSWFGLQVPGLRVLMTRDLTQSSNFIRAYQWRECNRSDAFVKPQRNDTVPLSVFPQFSGLSWLLCSAQAPALSSTCGLLPFCHSLHDVCVGHALLTLVRPLSTVVYRVAQAYMNWYAWGVVAEALNGAHTVL